MEIRISELGLVTTLQNADFLATVQDGVTSKITGNQVAFSVKSIANLTDKVYVDTSIATAIANLIDGAPQMLDTLRELADAMHNNPEFYNDLQDAINNSVQDSDFQEYFDDAFDGKNTYHLAEGSNLYWTQERFDQEFAAKNTYHLVEGSNLYYTPQRVLDLLAPQITTETLNVKNIVFTGTGIVDINSGNDLQLNAAGEIFINGKTTEQRVHDVLDSIPPPPPPDRLVNGGKQVVLESNGYITLANSAQLYDYGSGTGNGYGITDAANSTYIGYDPSDTLGALHMDSYSGGNIRIRTTTLPNTYNDWLYSSDGVLSIPTGGDIKRNGVSVLNSFSGSYNDLANKPVLFSGSYADLTNKPTAPTFTSVTATDLNVENITFTGAGPVSFTSGNDLAFVAPGDITFNGNTLSTVATSGSYNDLTNKPAIAEKTTGSWTLSPGANTVSLTVPGPGTYSIWVNGNIPSGIVTYTATVVVTNTNVPVVGSSYGWYYAAGNALVLTAIPNQVVGTANGISTAVVSTTTANVFTFGITNNSGSSQIVNWGYTKL